jgi:pimeloyl-ACP methyl ester carboxylesterase
MESSSFEVPGAAGRLVGEQVGDGPWALVLHGGPGLSDYTGALAHELREKLTTVRYTQRGVAPSTTAGSFTVEDHVADAVAVLDGLGVEAAWLVGHSWGGHLAMHVAVAHPERTLGFVCIDTLGAAGDGGYAEFERELGERYERTRGRPLAEDATLADYWPFYFPDPDVAPAMPPMQTSAEVYAQTFGSIRAHLDRGTLEQRLPLLDRPAVFIHGRDDPLPWSASDQSAALIPGGRLAVLERCGHFPWLENPGAVAAAASALL